MKAPKWLVAWLLRKSQALAQSRPPDVNIGGTEDDPYMLRWWVIPRNPVCNLYVHKFRHSDEDRALHDHPWVNGSLLLAGTYTEHTIAQGGIAYARVATAGDIKLRRSVAAHRIELTDGECWSFFVTGPRLRQWGFHCPRGWISYIDFTDPKNRGLVGPGCGET